jgi:hypothetical protein
MSVVHLGKPRPNKYKILLRTTCEMPYWTNQDAKDYWTGYPPLRGTHTWYLAPVLQGSELTLVEQEVTCMACLVKSASAQHRAEE